MKRISVFWRVLCMMLALGLCIPLCAIGGGAEAASVATVSYGVNVFSAAMDMAVSSPAGNEIVFSDEVFARALNLSKIDFITVRSLPEAATGALLMGSTRVTVGQTISGANLSHLCFAPATDDITRASFTFGANGASTALVCNMYFLAETNYTPTLSMVPDLSLELLTYRNMNAYGTLSAYEPDGDAMVFEIVSYPKNGALLLTDMESGSYVYLPEEGFVGADSFSYVARDVYGNYSASKTVDLRIGVSGVSVTYADMENHPLHSAALTLTEAGVMSGTQVGQLHYFYPDKAVTRAEFLVMAMNAVGITEVPACSATSFYDDAQIPPTMKGYVAAAYSMGYISGTNVEGNLCFLPSEEITRAQAAVIVGNILSLTEVNSAVQVFADHSDIPVWASDSIYALYAAGVMSADDGYISPTAKITRAESAEMLASAMRYGK